MNTLLSHPDHQPGALLTVEATAERSGADLLSLRYHIKGDTQSILIAPLETPRRSDNLWRSTCFEAFISIPASNAYYELNFSPSRLWAAYRFNNYREGMSAAQDLRTPDMEITAAAGDFQIDVTLSLAGISELTDSVPWAVGLSAVIEDRTGGRSFWALKHPPGNPDFHHSDCFVLQMPPALLP